MKNRSSGILLSLFLLLLLAATFPFKLKSQVYQDSIPPKMEWFTDAKLGIFIHWGIYAVEGTSESWSFHNRRTTYPYYMGQMRGFKAQNYKPQEWADLIRESGARYAVITLQHHDGVALWNTRQLTPTTAHNLGADKPLIQPKKPLWNPKKPLSTIEQTPAGRDLITPFVAALRERGLKFGAYYSLLNWSHNDYNGFFKDYNRYKINEDTARWNRFLSYMHGQIREISSEFNPDLYWFDGDWEHTEEEWKADEIQHIIQSRNPAAIVNGRLKSFGDYHTPEQNMPVTRPSSKVWELCLTSNDNWGWRPNDTLMKSTNQIIRVFAECISMGGNLLLDIGPKQDGTITPEQTQLLKELGRWTRKHQEAIFGSREGLPYGHFHGPSTLSKDSTTLYLFLTDIKKVKEGNTQTGINLMLKGIRNKVVSAQVIGDNNQIPVTVMGKIDWSSVPGTLFLEIDPIQLDEEVTVVKVQLDGPIRLYRGKGGFAD
ncbi:MAG: alpha-L-fucosidase [Bacteroidetes bacterium]|nr:alpha-L-fucosidase [Bacteroidota bacterium]